MRTSFRVRQPYLELFLRCADEYVCHSPARPTRFMRKMRENTGMAGGSFGQLDEQGLERKNPVIVALGDSVTAGHFESLMTPERIALTAAAFEKLKAGAAPTEAFAELTRQYGSAPIEVYDARESYIEKFREMLIDKYELTSVSVVNSGIAGDVLPSMAARSERDVIRYDPDLILLNGSLNWDDARLGDAQAYKVVLKALVQRFKAETTADIILLTPNGDLPNRSPARHAAGRGCPVRARRLQAGESSVRGRS